MNFGVNDNSDRGRTKLPSVACMGEEERRKERSGRGVLEVAFELSKATSIHVGHLGIKGSCVFGNVRPFTLHRATVCILAWMPTQLQMEAAGVGTCGREVK
jgi:hypothetical protein